MTQTSLIAPYCAHRGLRRLAWSLAAVLCLWTVFPVNGTHGPGLAHANSPAKYEQAKKELDSLYKDSRRSEWREPWQSLADDFYAVYTQEKKWSNRPAALFRSALALDEMSRRSYLRADAQKALSRYLMLADGHRASPLADDALLRAAQLQAERLGEPAEAIALLEGLLKNYTKGEEAPQARALLKKWTADEAGRDNADSRASAEDAEQDSSAKAEEPATNAGGRIRKLAWSTKGRVVRVEIALNRAVPWEVRSQAANSKAGTPPRLLVDVFGARPDAAVAPGGKVVNSPLKRVRLDYHKSGNTRVLLDFSSLQRFSVNLHEASNTLIIQGSSSAAALPGGLAPGKIVRSPSAAAAARRRAAAQQEDEESRAFMVATRNLASQFGLKVRTVVIDAGHGGKDPGTNHNGVLEREMTLDLSNRLGKSLRAAGFEVKYTRTKNEFVALDERSAMANRMKGDLFISLHVNASTNTKLSGLETYYLDMPSSTATASLASIENMLSNRKLGDLEKMIAELLRSARKDESRRLARDLQKGAITRLTKKKYPIQNGGSRGAPFVVLMGTTMPGVLVEVGYCSNPKEAKWLTQNAFKAALVQGLADGVSAYAERLREVTGQ